uniref:Uncharacterized protein LOC109691823 n=1 Tax=Castor canadensis TaxID=51338 RepID=A0A8B7V9U3_CASCN|nr:uncharacterized protein LOC109691823 [Castor canadensis]
MIEVLGTGKRKAGSTEGPPTGRRLEWGRASDREGPARGGAGAGGPARGGAAAIAANGLNEAGGVACALAAQWPAQAGRAGAGSGALSQGAVSARSPRPSVRGSSARQRGRARPPPARGSRDRDWTLRAAFGRHRPAAEMCDCFHVVLPTWPGAPGSGAPPPRLQPAPLWRVGSAGALGRVGGAQCGPDCALAGGRTSLAFGAWLAALSCISPYGSPGQQQKNDSPDVGWDPTPPSFTMAGPGPCHCSWESLFGEPASCTPPALCPLPGSGLQHLPPHHLSVSGRQLQPEGPDAETEENHSVTEGPTDEIIRPRPQGSSPVYEYTAEGAGFGVQENVPGRRTSGRRRSWWKRHSGDSPAFSSMSNPEAVQEATEVTLKTEVEAGATGYSVTGGGDQGIFVKQVLKDSPADTLFSLREGDQLLSTTIFFDDIKYEDAFKILQYSEPYKVQFKIKRKLPASKEDEWAALYPQQVSKGKEKKQVRLCPPKWPEATLAAP